MSTKQSTEPRRISTTLLARVEQVRENRAKAARCEVSERAVLESLIEAGLAAEERREARAAGGTKGA